MGGGPAQDAVGQTAFCPRSLSHSCALTICWAVWEEGKWELKHGCVPVWLLQSHKGLQQSGPRTAAQQTEARGQEVVLAALRVV